MKELKKCIHCNCEVELSSWKANKFDKSAGSYMKHAIRCRNQECKNSKKLVFFCGIYKSKVIESWNKVN